MSIVQDTDYDMDENYSFDSITSRIDDIVKDWKPYDKKLFDLYFMQGTFFKTDS